MLLSGLRISGFSLSDSVNQKVDKGADAGRQMFVAGAGGHRTKVESQGIAAVELFRCLRKSDGRIASLDGLAPVWDKVA